MKIRIRIVFLLFFSFLVIQMNFIILSNSYRSSHIEKTETLQFNSTVSYRHNASYYVFINHEQLEISVKVSEWGYPKEGVSGLLIQVFDDSNATDSSPIEAWLVPANDLTQHYFLSDNILYGIYKVVFSPYNINSAKLYWTTKASFSIWTYEDEIRFQNSTYFKVERSVSDNVSLSTIKLVIMPVTRQNITIHVEVEDQWGNTISFKNISLQNYLLLITELNATAAYTTEQLYRLNFYTTSDIGITIYYKIYYERMKNENIARVFLNYNYEGEVPIDMEHKEMFWMPETVIIDSSTIIHSTYFSFKTVALIWVTVMLISSAITIIILVKRDKNIAKKNAKLSKLQEYNEITQLSKYTSKKVDTTQKALYRPYNKTAIIENIRIEDFTIESQKPKLVKCAICYQSINETDELIRCPVCDAAFHKEHLYKWLIAQGTCPICKSKLKIKTPNSSDSTDETTNDAKNTVYQQN